MTILCTVAVVKGQPVAHTDIPEIGRAAKIAQEYGIEEYIVVQEPVTLWVGDLINPETKETVAIDESLDGVYINDGDVPAWLQTESGNMISVRPGGMVLTEFDRVVDGSGGGGKTCNVTCGTGYYACCNTGGNAPTCLCVQNTQVRQCQAGGPGSTNCSVSQ
ncbi:MAG: hypothetical protein AB7V18_19645 [Pyrinomonadaceae bacterium]